MSLPSEATTPMSRIQGILDTEESSHLIAATLKGNTRARRNTDMSEGEGVAYRVENSSRSLNRAVSVVPPNQAHQIQHVQKRVSECVDNSRRGSSVIAGVDQKVDSDVCSSTGDASVTHSNSRQPHPLKRVTTNVPGWFTSQSPLDFAPPELNHSNSRSASAVHQSTPIETSDKSVSAGLQSPNPPYKTSPFDIPNPESPATKAETAKDLEDHTKLVHGLWADLKQWRAETKTIDPGMGEGAALLLGLRHMAFQINQTREVSKLQLAISYKMCSLAAECGQVIPQTEAMSSALRGERYSMSRTISHIEDGYGDDCSFENKSPAIDVSNDIKFDSQGDLTVSVETLLKACQNNTQTTSSPNLVTAIERQRKEMAVEIEQLTNTVEDIREREESSRAQHHERVEHLLSRISSVSGERDALLDAQKQHREKTDVYQQAFSEYRMNMQDMRSRLDALTKENYQLRRDRAAQFTSHGRVETPISKKSIPLVPSSSLCDSIVSPSPAKVISSSGSRGYYRSNYPEEESPVLVVATREESSGRDVPPDAEFEAFSFEIENRLASLGKLASPEIAAVQSLSPDFGATDADVRSLSPSRYLPPTPQIPPPQYDPSTRPPFVLSSG